MLPAPISASSTSAPAFMKAEIPGPMKAFMAAPTPAPVIGAYAIFAVIAFAVYHFVAARAYSSVLTMGAIVQCLGLSFLCIQVLSSKSAAGISASSLKMDAFAIVFRLSSTTWLNGYLPVDKSGDHVYQIMDAVSLVLILFLLYRVLVVNRITYDEVEDSMQIRPMVIVSLMLGAVFHGNMDASPLFDTFWLTGLFCGVVAVFPHFWLIIQTGGHVDPMTCHYIAATALSRVLSGLFMWEARHDIKCKPYISGVEHTIIVILIAHAAHLLLLADFAYHYGYALFRKGFNEPVQMVGNQWI
jgi:hypothetical protein